MDGILCGSFKGTRGVVVGDGGVVGSGGGGDAGPRRVPVAAAFATTELRCWNQVSMRVCHLLNIAYPHTQKGNSVDENLQSCVTVAVQ